MGYGIKVIECQLLIIETYIIKNYKRKGLKFVASINCSAFYFLCKIKMNYSDSK